MGTPSPELLRAFQETDPKELLKELAPLAEACLRRKGLILGREFEPCATSVMDVVNTALELALSGDRPFPSGCNFRAYLRMLVKQVAFNQKRTLLRSRFDPSADAGERETNPGPSPEDLVMAGEREAEICEAVGACALGDPVLEEFHRALKAGCVKLHEIAEFLEWRIERVKAVRIKLQRVLARRFPGVCLSPNRKRRKAS